MTRNVTYMLEEHYSDIQKPMKYISETTGKNSRTLIINYLYGLLGIDDSQFNLEVDKVVGVIHNASLLVDDVQDESLIRRGKECAHLIYGNGLTINSGYLSIFSLLKENTISRFIKNKDLEINKLLVDALYNLHVGQGLDIYWTTTQTIPSIDDFNDMIDGKTGSLFKLILELGFLYTNTKSYDMVDLIKNISRFFQIRDDYINITDSDYWGEKGFCQDLDEKKVSFIFTLLNGENSADKIFESLTSKDKLSNGDKLVIYGKLYYSGILDKTYLEIENYKKNIINLEKEITGSTETSSFLDKFFKNLKYHRAINPDNVTHALTE